MTADHPVEPADDAAPAPRRNQTLALAAAAVLGVAVVVAVLIMTFAAGSDEDAATSTTGIGANPIPADSWITDLQEMEVTVPPGDYTEFCAQAVAQVGPSTEPLDAAGFQELLETIDYDALIAVSPEGLRPSIEAVRDLRPEVIEVLEQVEDAGTLTSADFPEGYLEGFGTVLKSSVQECSTEG